MDELLLSRRYSIARRKKNTMEASIMKKRASVYRLQWNDDIFYYTKTTGAMFLMSGFASLCTDRKKNQSLENTRKARCTLVQRAFCVMALVDCFDRMNPLLVRGGFTFCPGVQVM